MQTFSKHFAEGSDEDIPKNSLNRQHIHHSKHHYKAILSDCRELISQLQQQNQKLEHSIRQKEIIIAKLVQEKQDHILHMATCNSQQLQQRIEEAQRREQQMREGLKEVAAKYERLMEREKAEIQKLKSYNRALRVENSRLRQIANQESKGRRIGSITTVSKSERNEANLFSFTKINQLNQQQEIPATFVDYQTPEKSFTTSNSTALQSTQLRRRSQEGRKYTGIPQNLFSNECLRQVRSEQLKEGTSCNTQREKQIEMVLRRVKEILGQSQDEQC